MMLVCWDLWVQVKVEMVLGRSVWGVGRGGGWEMVEMEGFVGEVIAVPAIRKVRLRMGGKVVMDVV